MKVLGIVGSTRRGGRVHRLCTQFLAGASDAGHETEILFLDEYRIDHCKVCWHCADSDKCSLQDEFHLVFKKVAEADSIILGCPCYWRNVPSLVKAFIDRHTGLAMYKPKGASLNHKMPIKNKIKILFQEMGKSIYPKNRGVK